ncbi:nuclear transport factor 2 family protein [Spongiibacter taiwanensis]|uniref:nuclear transport factor 2 family protein n=1 Tax=Spongiibacter taiwanensis TaxID=1748242 RepID=UPI0020354631|nr:nuclear transport factor 2 family protein [Spongiibacter taiwanensis]USA44765.1 nuclear transport factor 2 family protein [Spongiibacter taiwanensis]
MSEQQNKEIVEGFWQAFSASDADKTLSYLSDDGFSWWIAGDPKEFALAGTRDKAQFAELLSGVLKEAPDGLQMTPSAWTCQGERVAVEAESYGYVKGKLYNNLYHFLMTVRDGKICQVKEYLDTTHATQVLC